MTVTLEFLGHAGFVIRGQNHAVAIDPFLTGNPAASTTPDKVACTHIAITHAHADHYGDDTLAIARANNATVHATIEVCEHLAGRGYDNAEPGNTGGRVQTDFGYIALTHAVHSSTYDGTTLGPACGVVVNIDGVTIYHAGDTDLFSDMKLIGATHQPDIALLPTGDRFTMGPEQASVAAELIGAPVAVPMHYGTWPVLLTDMTAFKPSGVRVERMQPGDTRSVHARA